MMIFFIAFSLLILLLINGYIALRAWSALEPYSTRLAVILVIFIILSALMFPLTRWLSNILPYHIVHPLYMWGVYWLGTMFYAFLILLFIDIMRIIKHFFPQFILFQISGPALAGAVIVVLLIINIYGTWNAQHPVVNEYRLTLNKKNSSLDSLRIVMISDFHLGWVYRLDALEGMVEKANALNPDIMFLVGDIVDEGIDLNLERLLPYHLNNIQAPLGIYAVLGNHEYISGQQDVFSGWLEQAGIHILRDSCMNINDDLYIVGRDDLSGSTLGSLRLSLEELLANINTQQLPVIVLDHQPTELEKAAQADIDLQFSGHTHRGQLFPNHLITQKIFAQDWGYFQKGNYQAIVSSGYGTWGPPIRLGNHPEMVLVNVTFTSQ